ncbi:hypothetical protein PAMP_012808 [Pampus punctatissimus]
MGVPAPPAGSYRVQRDTPPSPPPPPENTPVCSSEEDQEDTSTIENQVEYADKYIYSTQDQSYQTSGGYTVAEPPGNQWYHQSCWQQVYPTTTQEASYPYQHYLPYLIQDPPLHTAAPSYPESTTAGDGQMDGHGSGQY